MCTSLAAWTILAGAEAYRTQHSGRRLGMLPERTDMPRHSCKSSLEQVASLTAAVAGGRPLTGPLRCAGLHGGEHDVQQKLIARSGLGNSTSMPPGITDALRRGRKPSLEEAKAESYTVLHLRSGRPPVQGRVAPAEV